MWENIETSTLQQQKKEQAILRQNEVIKLIKFFTENLLTIEMRKAQILVNKLPYLGLSILELSKIVLYEFWYGYVEAKYEENAEIFYMDTERSIVYVKQMIFIKTLLKQDLILQTIN